MSKSLLRNTGLFVFLLLAVPAIAQDPPPPLFNILSPFDSGSKPEDIAIADYDGDGELDAAIGNTYFSLNPELGSITVIFNEGDGTFTQMVGEEQFVGFRTEGVTAGDFDGDGFPDIAAANFNLASSNVVILLSDGASRTFTEFQTIPLTTGGTAHPPRHVRAGHWNPEEDSFLDLATANYDSDTVSLLTGNGDGTFNLVEPFIVVGDGPETVTLANLNGDSDVDLLITNALSNTMTVLLGAPGASFSVAATFSTGGSRPRFSSALDFDADGRDDFVVSHWDDPGTTVVFRNLGLGTTFSQQTTLSIAGTNTRPIHPTIGDLNNDGFADVVVSYFGADVFALYPGLPSGSFDFGSGQIFVAGDGAYGTAILNFDASDGSTLNDLLVTNTRDHEAVFYMAVDPPTGSGAFIEAGGVLSVEAEHFHDIFPSSSNQYDWQLTTSPTGASGSVGMEIVPGGESWKTNYANTAPELGFLFEATQTGTHYIWVRGHGPNGGSNSVHVGIDGLEVAAGTAINLDQNDPSWVWSNGGHELEVTTLGLHTLNLWGREAGVKVDKVVLTTNPTFVPSGVGPVESAGGGGGSNTAPTAVDDAFVVEEDSTANVLDVLSNDSDPDVGDTLSIVSVTTPTLGGSVSIISGGTELSYTPAAATAGVETFDYTIEDPSGDSDTATVTMTIDPPAPNQSPVAVDDGYSASTNSANNTLPVLTNDSDPDVGDTLLITSVGPTSAGGTVTIAAGSTSLLYSPATGFEGVETFDYTIEDPDSASASATVTVTVSAQLAFEQDAGAQGFLAIEMENYHEATPRSGYDWTLGTTPGGFGGTGAMAVLPDDFQSFKTNFTGVSPELKFYFQAVHSGTHHVWVRGHGPSTSSDSLHVGLDGAEVPTSSAIAVPTGSGYGWSNGVHTLEIPAPGLYCLNVWSRETGTTADRVVLTIDGSFTPSGVGPAESPQQGQNQSPIAVADNATVNEDSAGNVISVLTNDSDPELDTITVTAVSTPSNGTASIVNGNTQVSYTPVADFSGPDSFTYTISDGNSVAMASVSVTVTGFPDPPTAFDDLSFAVEEDASATTLDVLANDTDSDAGDLLTVVSTTTPTLGGVVLIVSGGTELSYTPAASTVGTEVFDYTIEDSTGNSSTATVNVTISAGPPNQTPIAIDDSFSVAHDVVAATLDVLGNDFDPDPLDVLTIVSVGATSAGGTVVISGGGTELLYTPVTGFSGDETFDYTVEDPELASSVATVTVTVAPAGPPAFVQSAASQGLLTVEAENYHASILRSGREWQATTSPTGFIGASAMHVPGGYQSWTSNVPNSAPELKFYFQASHVGTHYVWVRGYGPNGGANSLHIGLDDQFIPSAASIPIAKQAGYVWSSGAHTVDVTTLGVHCLNLWAREAGTLVDRIVLTVDSGFTPTPDGPTESPQTGQNLPPVAVDDGFTVNEDSTDNVLTVLTNDSDPEADPLTITSVTQPAQGTTTINGSTILFTPAPNASGADTFNYTISALGGTANATVNLTVTGLSDPPVALDDSYSLEENSPQTTLDVLVNDSDPDVGDTLTIVSVTPTSLGATATIAGGGGSIAYTPATDAVGADVFSYTIEDNLGNSDTATVTVTLTVGPPNVPPVAVDDAYSVLVDSTSSFDVLANDSDPDGVTVVIVSVTTPNQGGTASSILGGTAISYTPANGFTGQETFDYMIEDADLDTALATVTVTVLGGGTGAFLMDGGPDGLLVLEAESFHRETNSSDSDNASWDPVASPPVGVEGGAMAIVPVNSGPWPSGYVATAPELEFDFVAARTGTFYIWIRGQSNSSGKNSVHLGLDGAEVLTAEKIEFDPQNPDWGWNLSTHSLVISSVGSHTLNLWGREHLTNVDRIVLTLDPDYVPAGSGPPASPTDLNPPTVTTRVIQISVSGLHADAVATLGAGLAPNLFRMRTEGAFTDAARVDPDSTGTVPNHVSLLTGRYVPGATGHGWNTETVVCGGGSPSVIHGGGYVDSAFDVVHDNGFSTAHFASRAELCLVEQSWDAANGAPDVTGADDGTKKIDRLFRADLADATVVEQFVADLQVGHYDYSVLQLGGPEVAGHATGFDLTPGSAYLNAVAAVDALIGDVLDTVDGDPHLAANTFVILTAEHGGRLSTTDHSDPAQVDNAAVPFYVWGGDVLAGMDLYAANGGSRAVPGATVPAASSTPPPIRGGDAPNLALDFLGLPPVPGSTINSTQDLVVP